MKPYVPDSLPLTKLDLNRLFRQIGPANAALARYDGLLQSVINSSVMLSPLTNQEAVLSSKIEGTQATVDEVLEYVAGIEFDPELVKDIQEIVNYRSALTLAKETLSQRPLNLLLLRQMHGAIMNSVRGADKNPGQFRSQQNWIGPEGCTMEQAPFVPPSPLHLRERLQQHPQQLLQFLLKQHLQQHLLDHPQQYLRQPLEQHRRQHLQQHLQPLLQQHLRQHLRRHLQQRRQQHPQPHL